VTEFDASGDTRRTLDAVCPDGSVVLGGGFDTNDEAVTITSSLPLNDGSAWRVEARGPLDDWHLRSYAICAIEE
jgi:hypothetical protein